MFGLSLGLIFIPAFSIEKSLSLAHLALESIEGFNGGILQPEYDKDRYLLQATRDEAYERNLLRICMRHSSLGHGLPWDLAMSQAFDQELNMAMILFDAAVLPMNKLGVLDSWSFLLCAAPSIVQRIKPCFALINGTGQLGITFNKMGSLGVPHVITPWTYFRSSVLNSKQKKSIETLPDCKIDWLEDGLVLRPVSDFYSKPSKQFLSALAEIDINPPFQYRQSLPPREG